MKRTDMKKVIVRLTDESATTFKVGLAQVNLGAQSYLQAAVELLDEDPAWADQAIKRGMIIQQDTREAAHARS